MNIMILADNIGNNCENSVEFIKDILDMQNNLPIDSIEQQFKALLRDEHIVVEAETGSGPPRSGSAPPPRRCSSAAPCGNRASRRTRRAPAAIRSRPMRRVAAHRH